MIDISAVMILITTLMSMFELPVGVTAFVTSLISQLPTLAAAGTDVVAFVKSQLEIVRGMIDENRDPTDAEWTTLNATMDAEFARLGVQATPPGSPAVG